MRFKNLSQIPSGVNIVKSNDAIEAINYLIQNRSEFNYEDLSAMEAVFFESVNNGEDSEIRLQHIENIRNKWYPQDY